MEVPRLRRVLLADHKRMPAVLRAGRGGRRDCADRRAVGVLAGSVLHAPRLRGDNGGHALQGVRLPDPDVHVDDAPADRRLLDGAREARRVRNVHGGAVTDEHKPRVWVADYSAPPGERVRLCVPLTWYEDVVTARCERTFESDPSLDAATVRVHPRRDR